MAYFKLAVLSIMVSIIGLMHGPVLVSCRVQGGSLNVIEERRFDERRFDEEQRVFLLQDDGLQNDGFDGGFDGGFGGGFEMLIPLLFLSGILMAFGIGVTTTTASTTSMTAATTAATTAAVTTAAVTTAAVTTATTGTTATVTTTAPTSTT